MPVRKLTDNQVRAILRAHVIHGAKAAKLAEKYEVSVFTVRDILYGRSHLNVTRGQSVAASRGPVEGRREVILRVFAETGSRAAAARAAGVTWGTANYHVRQAAT